MESPMAARQHRLANGWTIRELAQRSGVSTQTIVSIEKGRPARVQSFNKIAEALDVPLLEIREYRDIVANAGR